MTPPATTRRAAALAAAVVGLLAAGCQPAAPGLTALEVLNEANCKGAETGLHRVDYADLARLRGSTLLGVTEPDAPESAELVLLSLSKGRQPTPGYGFELLGADQAGSRAELTIAWQTPPADAVLAQVVTHPCIVVGLERGTFEEVRVVDPDGAALGALRL